MLSACSSFPQFGKFRLADSSFFADQTNTRLQWSTRDIRRQARRIQASRKTAQEHKAAIKAGDRQEQRKYLQASTNPLRDVATLIVETGMRPEEVFRITKDNVSLDQGYVYIPFGKTKAARRRIPLTVAAQSVLKAQIESAKGLYVFPHRKDCNRPMTPMTSVKTAHATALLISKVASFRIYDLRHTWATRAAEAGMDMPTLAALLGHSNMVMRYLHPQEKHQADAVRRLEAFNAAKEIAEAEKKQKASKDTASETVPTISPTPAEIQNESSDKAMAVN